MTNVPKKLGRTRIPPHFTGDPNNPETCSLSVDPRLGTGVSARIGSLGMRNVSNADAELYQKWGLLDTNWRLVGGGVGGNAEIVCIDFVLADWVTSNADDLWQIVIDHGLGTECLNMQIFDENKNVVSLHNLKIVNGNRISLKVSQAEVDCRFNGKINIVSLI